MIDCIIFSKDRACQLEFLLRSLNLHVDLSDFTIKIIYAYSNSSFENGYKKLMGSPSKINWILEEDKKFKEMILKYVQEEYIMFLVDDICFINEFSTKLKEFQIFSQNERVLTLSLRLSPHINFCYASNHRSGTPNIKDGIWDWREGSGDWGYPNSIDGNVFRKKDIYECIKIMDFIGPSGLESRLGAPIKKIGKYLMCCFKEQRLVNFPLNMVDPENTNRSMNISTSELNEKYLSNKRISFETLKGIRNNTCHVEIKNLVFEENV